jgi:hypothetical protein
MRKARIVQTMAVLGLASVAQGQRDDGVFPNDYPYRAAFISTVSAPTGHTELVVFPFRGTAVKIPIRSIAAPLCYGPRGTALYGQCTPFNEGPDEPIKFALCKVELNTNTTTPVPGSTGLYAYDLALSNAEDRVLVSGHRRPYGSDVRGLFELTLPDARIRSVLLLEDGDYRSGFHHISVSPDGRRAVGTRKGHLELIDVSRGTTEPLGSEFFLAAWSPDGRWLAALEMGEDGRTILMDPANLMRRRIIGHTELDWSPDSRYLLGIKGCSAYYGTLEAVDVETGKRIPIKSSECKVNQATTGWVRADIAP